MINKSKYVIIPDGVYILFTSDNTSVEVLGKDLVSTYLIAKGHI